MLPKHKYLLTYRYSEIVHDLTVEFCRRFFVSNLGNLGYLSNGRTVAQMEHAARSGKQCIVEGVGQSRISKKGEIKLLGVALASIEELIADFEDFLRQKKLVILPKTDPKILAYRQWGVEATKLESPRILTLPKEPMEAANLLLTLCHQLTYLLSRQIDALEKKFVEEGGFSESLLRKRLAHRSPR